MTIHCKKPPTTLIHIPKTAGSAISRWMIRNASGKWVAKNTHGSKHATKQRAQSLLKHDLGTTIVCIRNPWDRFVSAYFYYKQRAKKPNFIEKLTFEQFIHNERHGCVDRPCNYYFDNVDILLRYENLSEDFRKVQHHFNNYSNLSSVNKSKHDRDYRKYYTSPELVDIVAKKHSADIERFGYSFE